MLSAFLKGFVSVFDITGQTLVSFPDLSKGLQKDAEALRGDWQRIGIDFRIAMDTVAHE